MTPSLDFPWPPTDPEITAAVMQALSAQTWGLYRGPAVPALEAALGAYHRTAHAFTCASGTLAVEVALRAVGVGPGTEVIMSAYDYEPNFLTIHKLGAQPVLVDVTPTGQMNADELEAAHSDRTKAILATHLHGGAPDFPRLRTWADRHHLCVIEDAAQATGAIVFGRRAGTWGDVAVLSFGGSKLLSAGRGGAILTDRADLAQRIRLVLHTGIQEVAPLSELQAVVLRPQLDRLEERNAERAARVRELMAASAGIDGLRFLWSPQEVSQPAFYKVGLRSASAAQREAMLSALTAIGLPASIGFRTLSIGRSPRRYRSVGPLAEATRFDGEVFVLPHPVLSAGSAIIARIAEALLAVGKRPA